MSKTTKERLYREYLERLLFEDNLNFKDALHLVTRYVNDISYNHKFTLMEVHKNHFHGRPRNYVNYQTFRARRHFLRKFKHKPQINIHNVNKKLLMKNQIVYDETYYPYSWDGEKFWSVNFFE